MTLQARYDHAWTDVLSVAGVRFLVEFADSQCDLLKLLDMDVMILDKLLHLLKFWLWTLRSCLLSDRAEWLHE